MDNTKQPGIKVDFIFLKEMLFERLPSVADDNILTVSYSNNIGINEERNILLTELTCKVVSKNKKSKNQEVKFQTTMIGQFSKEGRGNMDLEQFAQASAPAIIFPYIRELLSNTTTRAGLRPIILPPTNFHAMGLKPNAIQPTKKRSIKSKNT